MVPDRNPDLGLRFSFFLIETLSITGQKFSKCLKNGMRPFTKESTAPLPVEMTRNTTLSGFLNHDINQLVIEKIT